MDESEKDRIGGVIFRGSMVKKLLLTLPDGCWIASGISRSDGSPVMTAQVGDLESRAALWARMKAARADGRIFYVFRDEEAMNAHLEEWQRIQAKSAARYGQGEVNSKEMTEEELADLVLGAVFWVESARARLRATMEFVEQDEAVAAEKPDKSEPDRE